MRERRAGGEMRLRAELERIDGRPYGFYRDLRGGAFDVAGGVLRFDHVQGDPFAAPSRLCLELPPEAAGLPAFALASSDARRAAADSLQRRLREAGRRGAAALGSGKSGLLEIAGLGPEILDRSAVRVAPDGGVRLRFWAGLPARGRRILGREAAVLLTQRLPDWIDAVFGALDVEALRGHVEVLEDQMALRAALRAGGLIAFVGDGSVLPRRSGADSAPLRSAVRFEAPASLRVELEVPHAGRLTGMGIGGGVTLIVGGGYHGKSTLLSTLALGIYDHVPGDGRERCVTLPGAVSIRAEDGRAVRGVDLRPFIGRLPLGRGTERFDTDDASGSTSQAAAIVEALEVGAEALLIDEDTAATNFMIRDVRMRALIPAEHEPITPFLDRVRQLSEDRGVASVLVVGGAGDYLDVADRVIQMQDYRPHDVTERAREVARELPLGAAAPSPPGAWPPAEPRVPDPRGLDPSRGRKAERVRSVRTRSIEFGSEEIDVSALYQLVDPAQCRAIGDALLELARGRCDGRRSIAELMDALDADGTGCDLELVGERGFGDRAAARRFEIAAALNRLRTLALVR